MRRYISRLWTINQQGELCIYPFIASDDTKSEIEFHFKIKDITSARSLGGSEPNGPKLGFVLKVSLRLVSSYIYTSYIRLYAKLVNYFQELVK